MAAGPLSLNMILRQKLKEPSNQSTTLASSPGREEATNAAFYQLRREPALSTRSIDRPLFSQLSHRRQSFSQQGEVNWGYIISDGIEDN